MVKDNTPMGEVNVRRIPVDVKQRADEAAKRLGFPSVHQWARTKIYELAGEAE